VLADRREILLYRLVLGRWRGGLADLLLRHAPFFLLLSTPLWPQKLAHVTPSLSSLVR
jgi:hypothetical protein